MTWCWLIPGLAAFLALALDRLLLRAEQVNARWQSKRVYVYRQWRDRSSSGDGSEGDSGISLTRQ